MAEKTIFDNLNDIFYHKTKWEEYSETERKKFGVYMVNRWISMSFDCIEVINYLQQYTVGLLSNKEVYNLYRDIFPKMKFFVKYIKADKDADDEKYSKELVKLLQETFFWNEDEVYTNLKLIKSEDLQEFLKDRGFSDSDIKKQFKIK